MLPTIFIIGKSGAGKDFYCKMVQNTGRVLPVIQYTTRPIREDEINGKDVNCVTKEEFDKLLEEDKIFEYRSYNVNYQGKVDTWYYGTPTLDGDIDGDTESIYVLAATVDIVKSACQKYKDPDMIEVIFIDTSDDVRRLRASTIRKSFDESEWDRRVIADAKDYSDARLKTIEELTGKKVHHFDNNRDEAKDDFFDFYAAIAGKLISKYKERKTKCQ